MKPSSYIKIAAGVIILVIVVAAWEQIRPIFHRGETGGAGMTSTATHGLSGSPTVSPKLLPDPKADAEIIIKAKGKPKAATVSAQSAEKIGIRWDFEYNSAGIFVKGHAIAKEQPLISIDEATYTDTLRVQMNEQAWAGEANHAVISGKAYLARKHWYNGFSVGVKVGLDRTLSLPIMGEVGYRGWTVGVLQYGTEHQAVMVGRSFTL